MSTSPWRSMSRAPKDRLIVAALDPKSEYGQYFSERFRVFTIDWLPDEQKWWAGGCFRYDASDFLGWVPTHPAA